MKEMPPFDPDPEYRISAEEREALSPWVSVRAAERYLAAFTEEQRKIALRLLGPVGGNEDNLNVQQLEPTGHPDWDRAIWDLYEDVRAYSSASEDFPFPNPDRTGQRAMSDRETAAERLEKLYFEDRAEHSDVPPMGTPEYDALRERDRARRAEASELLAALGGLERASAEDLYHAAWLLNHGDAPDDARRAHELARAAADAGHERAPWLAAAAYDRWCMYEGRPQKFGTQFVPDGKRYRLWDVEPATTDEERAAHGVPTLEEQRRRAERMTREEPQPPMDLTPDWLREALDRWAAGPDSEPTIRPLGRHEIDVYRRIRREALTTDPDAFGETIQAFEAHTDEGLAAWLETHAGRPDRGILIAEIEGTPVAMSGFGRRHDDPEEGFVWGVFVSPGARRRGIAADLLARARSALEEAGVTRITARVAAPNEGALEFYRAQGFTIGERTGMLREGSDVPVYRIEARLERDGPEEPEGQ